ncbi:MAG: HIT domain-containing protein, partial [Asgard group archaeon]|nr:HIT domain-containing protein [Asgard group archaeon]
MKKIWAPWRIEYILQSKDAECFICKAISDNSKNDKKNLVLYRGKESLVLLNKYPYISGHLMIAPNTHTPELSSILEKVSSEMWNLMVKSIELLKKSISPDGFNIGMNLGKIAGAGLETHIHIPIVPRWVGDTNFMPIL